MKTNSWTTAGQAKDICQAPTHWLKFYEEAVIESEAPNHSRAIKEWSIAINNDWDDN